ncbi:hypothetical protein C8Q74DRAFT_1370494 [Fomes fomentarius]|nr:hypothetical protein C8Q74DRAFT_1370494 [Fomes fomentarius]
MAGISIGAGLAVLALAGLSITLVLRRSRMRSRRDQDSEAISAPSDTDTAERRRPRNLITPFMQWRSRPLQSSTSLTKAIIRSSSLRLQANGSGPHLAQAEVDQRSSSTASRLVLAPESAVPALEPPTEPPRSCHLARARVTPQ